MELAHMIVVQRGWCWEEENIGILDLRDLIWANIWSVVAFVEESFTEYILDLEAMFELWIYFIQGVREKTHLYFKRLYLSF